MTVVTRTTDDPGRWAGVLRHDVLTLDPNQPVSGCLGIVIGVAIALPASRGFRAVLFGVTPADPLTFIVVPLFSAVVVVLASAVAGRRAMQVDLVAMLRSCWPSRPA